MKTFVVETDLIDKSFEWKQGENMGMLNESVQTIKGIGEKTTEDLGKMDIFTVGDLLEHFPMRYNIHEIKPLKDLVHEEQVTVIGKVASIPVVNYYGPRRSRLHFSIEVEGIAVSAVLFNRAFAKKQFKIGEIFTFMGKWDAHRLQVTVSTYKKGTLDEETKIEPVYSSKGSITDDRLKRFIRQALQKYGDHVEEFLPQYFLETYKIPHRKEAMQTIHHPKNRITLKHARRRFIYEEFLLFQLRIQRFKKRQQEAAIGQRQLYDLAQVEALIASLPYELTDAQKRSVNEILADMKSPLRMNRLLQGDVGSGKTAVAAMTIYASITAGKQVAFMVPTEILAEQHYVSLKEILGERAKVSLLTGSLKEKVRNERLDALEKNEINIIIGTHALIQNDVYFNDLGYIIIDEQHRFGVAQRRKLREKGMNPDVLFMTATPIPRTLAITAFGDMDVSVIDEMPSGRKEVTTYWVKENMLPRILEFIKERIKHGEQAYVICPLIEESDQLDIQNAVDLYEQLKKYYQENVSIGLLHGRLDAVEKDETMKNFIENKTQILVSTTVIEVGVNVPNATIMVIYDAQRFGLAQLHQLRGRVGRGEKESYCILIADAKSETSRERMKIMSEVTDGFYLAEEDLRMRGAGDFFGHKQSGLPDFKVGDVVADYRALETARKDAAEIIAEGLLENNHEYIRLERMTSKDRLLEKGLD